MSHPALEARSRVRAMRQVLDLLEEVDRFAPPDFLLSLAVGELVEYEAEQDLYGTDRYNRVRSEDELNDVGVFFYSWVQRNAQHIDMMSTLHTANGYGSHSAALDQLGPVIMDSMDDPYRAVPEVIARLASVGIHMPNGYIIFEQMQRTVDKVLRNRPPELYTAFCPVLGRQLRDEEVLRKYQHLERGTRMIRKAVNRTLLPSDWQPHYQQLVDWTQSETNLTVLEYNLTSQVGKIALRTELEKAKGNV